MSKIKCFFIEDTKKYQKNETNGIVTSMIPIYRRADTGEEMILANAPVGAMWFADWYGQIFNPQLKYSLVVKTPAGDWHIDQQSNNCTMPDDYNQRRHHCWIIEGEVPNITVSKNGVTCAAGGGSILMGSYHGFLRNGYLEEC